jgi:hypothetical protein
MHGDAARVVAAVLQAAQALDQDRDDIALGDRADDAAHLLPPMSRRIVRGALRDELSKRAGIRKEIANNRTLAI